MRKFLLFIGRMLFYLYPIKLHVKIKSMLNWIYTGWYIKCFYSFGPNSKLEGNLHLHGGNMISIGSSVLIGANASITAFNNNKHSLKIKVGNGCVFGPDCHISAITGVIIGDGLRTGKSVLISDNSHGDVRNIKHLNMSPDDRPLVSKGKIIIGKNVWIGDKVAVLSGVTIGDGAVIGANSVVTHDVPANSVAVGAPARIIYQN